MSGMQRIAVIPARGGSKRIPRKNIREFRGKPLIAHAIQAALETNLFDTVIVSTDDDEISEIAVKFGASVPFVREAELADDHMPVALVTLDAVERVAPDLNVQVAQLMANCPLCDAKDICDSYEQFVARGAEFQVSFSQFHAQNPWWAVTLDENGFIKYQFPEQYTTSSQHLPTLYFPTGALWWANARALKETRTFHTPKTIAFEMDWAHAIDIDTEDDWQFADLVYQHIHGAAK